MQPVPARDRPLLALLDGYSLAYRAFFALPPDLRTTTGQVTNAVYGFTTMLIKLLAEQKPEGLAVAFDRGRPAHRTGAHAGRTRPTAPRAPTTSARRCRWSSRC